MSYLVSAVADGPPIALINMQINIDLSHADLSRGRHAFIGIY